MAIQTETIVLKVEGDTTSAERATRRLALAQRLLQREVQGTSKAMAEIPATKTAGLIGNVGNALKSAGFDSKTFNQGLKDIGKGLTFDLIRQGLKGLNADLHGAAGAALSAGVNGAAMGAAFGGPVGAAIGAVGGALVGLIRHTDQQSAASLRAAEAAKKHAAALELVRQGETKERDQRRNLRHELELLDEEFTRNLDLAMKNGSGIDAPYVERVRRQSRETQAELEALNRADGVIWLEQKKREFERINALKDIEAAQRSGIITDIEAARRKKELAKADADSLDIIGKYKQKQHETAEAVERLNKALQSGQLDAKGYEKLLREVDEDYRARDDERKRREDEAIARAKKLREERAKQLEQEALAEAQRQAELRRYTRIRSVDEFRGALDLGGGELEAAARHAREQRESQLALQALEGEADRFGRRDQILANDKVLLQRQAMADALQREIDLQREYTSLVGEAYGALIDGSSGALESLKNVAKQQLVALGVREAVEAASQFAYGLGALANPLFAGAAAMHFASAAKHAAAAGLAGVGVAAVGAIGGGGGPSASSAFSGSGSAGGSSGGGQQVTHTVTNYIIVGDPHADNSPRIQQRNAQRSLALAEGKTSSSRAE